MATQKKGQSSRVVSAREAHAMDEEMNSVVPMGGV